MSNIKIKVLGPVGDTIHEIETNYSSDQLERFLTQNRIVVESDDIIVYYKKNLKGPFQYSYKERIIQGRQK
jgi:hypothetical protein